MDVIGRGGWGNGVVIAAERLEKFQSGGMPRMIKQPVEGLFDVPAIAAFPWR